MRRDGIRAAEGRERAREAEGREGVREPTEPRVHGRWIVQLMRMSLETYAELYTEKVSSQQKFGRVAPYFDHFQVDLTAVTS